MHVQVYDIYGLQGLKAGNSLRITHMHASISRLAFKRLCFALAGSAA